MRTRNVIITIVVVVVLIVAYWLISPLFIVKEVYEPSPLEIGDALDTMDEETMAEFERQVEEMKPMVKEMDDEMPLAVQLLGQGIFEPRAHEVQGKALLIEQDGKKVIRFEDFETINGPDLRIYLASDLGAKDHVDLGAIKATKGNVNYEIPSDIDTTKYNKVLVWCRAFRVLFSFAILG